jgi:hypothetical protein
MKTHNYDLLLALASILLIFNACPDKDTDKDYWDSSITIKNNSDLTLLRYFNFYDYPDTNLSLENPFIDSKQFELALINPKDSLVQKEAWIKYFEQPSTNKLMLFLFDKDTVEQVSWDIIRKKYLIIKRYDLEKMDLENSNWTIIYP